MNLAEAHQYNPWIIVARDTIVACDIGEKYFSYISLGTLYGNALP